MFSGRSFSSIPKTLQWCRLRLTANHQRRRKKVFQENKYINSFPTAIQLKGTLEATNPHLATLQRQHITVTQQRGEDQKRFHLRKQKKSLEKCCVSFCNKVSSKWHRAELPRGTYYCGGSLGISGQQNQIGNLFPTY